MNWLARLVGGGRKGKPLPPPGSAGLAVYEQLLKLLVASVELRAAVRCAVARAFAEPQAFYDVHHDYMLAERGLIFPESSALTPKFVFIDTLLAHNILAEVDWRVGKEEMQQKVRAIIQAQQFTLIVEVAEQYEEEPPHENIYLPKHQELAPVVYSLQTLDSNADCYVFTLVPRAAAKRVQALFCQL